MREATGLLDLDGEPWRMSGAVDEELLVDVMVPIWTGSECLQTIPGWASIVLSGSRSRPLSKLCLGRLLLDKLGDMHRLSDLPNCGLEHPLSMLMVVELVI